MNFDIHVVYIIIDLMFVCLFKLFLSVENKIFKTTK